MWAAGCIMLATPLPMVATRTALVAHTPLAFFADAEAAAEAERRTLTLAPAP